MQPTLNQNQANASADAKDNVVVEIHNSDEKSNTHPADNNQNNIGRSNTVITANNNDPQVTATAAATLRAYPAATIESSAAAIPQPPSIATPTAAASSSSNPMLTMQPAPAHSQIQMVPMSHSVASSSNSAASANAVPTAGAGQQPRAAAVAQIDSNCGMRKRKNCISTENITGFGRGALFSAGQALSAISIANSELNSFSSTGNPQTNNDAGLGLGTALAGDVLTTMGTMVNINSRRAEGAKAIKELEAERKAFEMELKKEKIERAKFLTPQEHLSLVGTVSDSSTIGWLSLGLNALGIAVKIADLVQFEKYYPYIVTSIALAIANPLLGSAQRSEITRTQEHTGYLRDARLRLAKTQMASSQQEVTRLQALEHKMVDNDFLANKLQELTAMQEKCLKQYNSRREELSRCQISSSNMAKQIASMQASLLEKLLKAQPLLYSAASPAATQPQGISPQALYRELKQKYDEQKPNQQNPLPQTLIEHIEAAKKLDNEITEMDNNRKTELTKQDTLVKEIAEIHTRYENIGQDIEDLNQTITRLHDLESELRKRLEDSSASYSSDSNTGVQGSRTKSRYSSASSSQFSALTSGSSSSSSHSSGLTFFGSASSSQFSVPTSLSSSSSSRLTTPTFFSSSSSAQLTTDANQQNNTPKKAP